MTEQEQIIALKMEVLKLDDEVLTLRSALRETLNFAEETAINAGRISSEEAPGGHVRFLEEIASRGLRLNESYRQLLDASLR